MKRTIGTALLSFAILASLFPETHEAAWLEAFDAAFALTVESRSGQVPPAIESRYRMLVGSRRNLTMDPAKAGESAALLMFRYEKDIRCGFDLQEAGARLVQAATIMNRDGDPGNALRKLEMAGNGAKNRNNGGPGSVAKTAGEAGRDMRGRNKGN